LLSCATINRQDSTSNDRSTGIRKTAHPGNAETDYYVIFRPSWSPAKNQRRQSRGALAVASDREFFFLTYQRFTSRTMIGHMGSDGSHAFSIEFSDALFPIAVTVLGPLKRKLDNSPGIAKKRGSFQCRAQYPALQLSFIRFPSGAT